jgi:hypothetical protein
VQLAISMGLIALAATLAVHIIARVSIGRSLVIGLLYTALATAAATLMVMLLPNPSPPGPATP